MSGRQTRQEECMEDRHAGTNVWKTDTPVPMSGRQTRRYQCQEDGHVDMLVTTPLKSGVIVSLFRGNSLSAVKRLLLINP